MGLGASTSNSQPDGSHFSLLINPPAPKPEQKHTKKGVKGGDGEVRPVLFCISFFGVGLAPLTPN